MCDGLLYLWSHDVSDYLQEDALVSPSCCSHGVHFLDSYRKIQHSCRKINCCKQEFRARKDLQISEAPDTFQEMKCNFQKILCFHDEEKMQPVYIAC